MPRPPLTQASSLCYAPLAQASSLCYAPLAQASSLCYDAFGIEAPENVKTDKREILAGSVRIDTVVDFSEKFDFTTLRDKIFPFWGVLTVVEYKGLNDRLQVGHFFQYTLTELGLITTRYLSKEREDRAERQWLSQRASIEQWQECKARGALHSCCTIILSTGYPRGLINEIELEEVTDYPHLEGALYRRVVFEDRFIGSLATYIVVLNKLPVCAKNTPLLLLTTGQKQLEFCHWLLSDECDLTEEEKHEYQSYLVNQNLIENEEVDKIMRYRLFGPPRVDWIFEGVAEKPKDYQQEFYQTAVKKALEGDSNDVVFQTLVSASSPLEVAQKAMGASSSEEAAHKLLGTSSSEEAAQKLLGVSSPLEMAQKALGASSPAEMLVKSIETDEQWNELLTLIEQRKSQAANKQPVIQSEQP